MPNDPLTAVSTDPPHPGRPSQTVPGTHIGIDIGGTKILAAEVDCSGAVPRVLAQAKVPTPGNSDEGLRALDGLVAALLGESAGRVQGIGLGVAGHLGLDGVLRQAANTPIFVGLDLGRHLSERHGLPTLVDNDANVASRAEYRLRFGMSGSGEPSAGRTLVLVTLGTGVGGAIIESGRVVRGQGGEAGEVGHMVVDPRGPRCKCGQLGCWEVFASGTALGRLAGERRRLAGGAAADAADPSGETVIDAALRGGSLEQAAFDEYCEWIALGVANLVQLLDPDVVALGGGVSAVGEPLLVGVIGHLNRYSARVLERGCRVELAEAGPLAGVVGAALTSAEAASPPASPLQGPTGAPG